MSNNISILKKDEVVEFYKNKKEWTIDEVEAFENLLIKIYNEDLDFFNSILGFNDSGYGKYSVMRDCISDWGLDGIFNHKYYSSHDIVDSTRLGVFKVSPFVKELNDFCIVDEVGLMNQFKQNIKIKKVKEK